tara:strand:+ start:5759 stop:5938 length:180 start_codon:yes stop_codon:yes gene_type:complete
MEQMTATCEPACNCVDLIVEIETFLKQTSHRHMIEASEIQNFLLDLRNLVENAESVDLN